MKCNNRKKKFNIILILNNLRNICQKFYIYLGGPSAESVTSWSLNKFRFFYRDSLSICAESSEIFFFQKHDNQLLR